MVRGFLRFRGPRTVTVGRLLRTRDTSGHDGQGSSAFRGFHASHPYPYPYPHPHLRWHGCRHLHLHLRLALRAGRVRLRLLRCRACRGRSGRSTCPAPAHAPSTAGRHPSRGAAGVGLRLVDRISIRTRRSRSRGTTPDRDIPSSGATEIGQALVRTAAGGRSRTGGRGWIAATAVAVCPMQPMNGKDPSLGPSDAGADLCDGAVSRSAPMHRDEGRTSSVHIARTSTRRRGASAGREARAGFGRRRSRDRQVAQRSLWLRSLAGVPAMGSRRVSCAEVRAVGTVFVAAATSSACSATGRGELPSS